MSEIELSESPSILDVYGRAVLSALPVVGASGDSLPDDTLVLRGCGSIPTTSPSTQRCAACVSATRCR